MRALLIKIFVEVGRLTFKDIRYKISFSIGLFVLFVCIHMYPYVPIRAFV